MATAALKHIPGSSHARFLLKRNSHMPRSVSFRSLAMAVGFWGSAALLPTQAAAQGLDSDLAVLTFDSAWSRVNASYYDPDFRGLDWEAVRDELRPRAAAASSREELREVLEEMLSRLGESHFGIISEDVADALDPDDVESGDVAAPGEPGIELRVVEKRLTVWRVREGGPAQEAGVRPGWVVTEIGDREVSEWLSALDALDEGEKAAGAMYLARRASAALVGPMDEPVRLVVVDEKDRGREMEVPRAPPAGQPVRFGNLPTMFTQLDARRIGSGADCIGVVTWNVWMTPITGPLDRAVSDLADCRGMVLDLRGNPGGVGAMVMGVSGYFMESREALGVMRTRENELRFVSNPRRIRTPDGTRPPFDGPLAILVDRLSASTTEIFAAGMQGVGRARLFGETTAGMALPALMIRLPTGDVLMHAFADFTGPDGTRIEGVGAIPDEEVPLSREALLAGVDAPLEAALAWIRGSGGGSGVEQTRTGQVNTSKR
jgi:carboxyl-terminal processing protease